MCFYRNGQKDFQDFYSEGHNLIYCNNICAMVDVLDHKHNTKEWILFIDSLKGRKEIESKGN